MRPAAVSSAHALNSDQTAVSPGSLSQARSIGRAGWSHRLADVLTLLLAVVAFGQIALAIIGGYRLYSGVPFWDMWDSYIGSYLRLSEGRISELWSQHNEHRIVLSKLLFWMDLGLLRGGTTPFLTVLNYVLAGAIVAVLALFLERLSGRSPIRGGRLPIILLLLVLLFSWTQHENFIWAFQGAFFAALLFPLSALYLLVWRADSSTQRPAYREAAAFVAACLLGLCSAGTIASGVLALPIMAMVAALAGLGRLRVIILMVLSACILGLYFGNYVPVGHHGSVRQALIEQPWQVFRYSVLYLGSPAYHLTGGSFTLARIVGTLTLLLACGFAVWAWSQRTSDRPYLMALIGFCAMQIAMAVGVAGGRLSLSMESAVSSRYSTPVLTLWASLIVMLVGLLGPGLHRHRLAVTWVAGLVALAFLPYQRTALLGDESIPLAQRHAALALSVGARDHASLARLYPDPEGLVLKARPAIEQSLSIFGHRAFRADHDTVGSRIDMEAIAERCTGHLDVVAPLAGENRFVSVEGWVLAADRKVPAGLTIVDRQGRVVGRAITGRRRPDVAAQMGRSARRSGFIGYLQAAVEAEALWLVDDQHRCRVAVNRPR